MTAKNKDKLFKMYVGCDLSMQISQLNVSCISLRSFSLKEIFVFNFHKIQTNIFESTPLLTHFIQHYSPIYNTMEKSPS
jgi:hypothetical protein